MAKAGLLQQAREREIDRRERKALTSTHGTSEILMNKVYSRDMPKFVERGWEVFSHQPHSYGAPERYTLIINRKKLMERLS